MSNKYGAWGTAVLGMKEQLLKDIEGMNYNFEDDGDEVWTDQFTVVGGYGIDINIVFPESDIFGDGKLHITAYPVDGDDTTDTSYWIELHPSR